MKLGVNWKKIDKVGGIVVLLLLFGYVIYKATSQTYHLAYYARYTIGEPFKMSKSGHLVKKVDYKYTVAGEEYERRENYQGGELGKRYFVKFSAEDPNYSDFLQDIPVPDSIKLAPPEGWEKLPIK